MTTEISDGRRRRGPSAAAALVAKFLLRSSFVNVALADQAMVSAVNFFTGVLLARILGFEEFGRFALTWTVITSVNIVQQALIIDPMLSIGAKQPAARAPRYFGAIVLHQCALSAMLILLIFVGLAMIDTFAPDWGTVGLGFPLVAAMAGFQWQELLRRQFLARGRIGMVLLNDAIRYLLQLAMLCTILLSHGRVSTAAVLWIIAGAAGMAILHGMLTCGGIASDRATIREVTIAHWRFSRWLLPSATLQAFSGSIFMVAAGYLHGAAVVGALRAAQNLVAFTHILFLGLENTVQVQAARALAVAGLPALRRELLRLWRWGGLVTAILLIVFCAVADRLVELVYGGAFPDVTGLVYLWAAAYMMHFANMPLRIGIRALERTHHFFNLQTATAFFSLAVAYPLVRYGAAPGVLLGQICCYVIEFAYLFSTLRPALREGLECRT